MSEQNQEVIHADRVFIEKEKRESEAKLWLEQKYSFSLGHVSKAYRDELIKRASIVFLYHTVEEAEKMGPNYRASIKTKEDEDWFEIMRNQQEVVDFQELDGFGNQKDGLGTNNFWTDFFPDVVEKLNKQLLEIPYEEIIKPKFKSIEEVVEFNRTVRTRFDLPFLVFLNEKGILFDAFKEVGFERIKKMHEAIVEHIEIYNKWKRLLGVSEYNWISKDLMQSSHISDESRKKFENCTLEFYNTLMKLFVALADRGVILRSMHR